MSDSSLQKMLVKVLALVVLFTLCESEITDKDLVDILGVDIEASKKVSWKDWVNKNQLMNPAAPGPPAPLCNDAEHPFGAENGTYTGCCDMDSDCVQFPNLRCKDGTCTCKLGHFQVLDINGTVIGCETRPKKELDEPCVEDVDNCYVAFSECGPSGTCVCKEDFARHNNVCKPLDYYCPYKKPYKPNGIIWPCLPHSDKNWCPRGYDCLFPVDGPRPRFLTASGQEQGYCCPLMPQFEFPNKTYNISDSRNTNSDLVNAIRNDTALPMNTTTRSVDLFPNTFFQEVCFYGENVEAYLYASYSFIEIGLGPTNCQTPCEPQPDEAVIRNGKCTYPGE